MNWTRKQLKAIASEKGFIKGNGVKIKIWEDGTITRADVRLDLVRNLTISEAVKALKLK